MERISAEQFAALRAQHHAALEANAKLTHMFRQAKEAAETDAKMQLEMPQLLPVPSWDPPTISTAKGVFLILTALQCLETDAAITSVRRCFERLGWKASSDVDAKWFRCLLLLMSLLTKWLTCIFVSHAVAIHDDVAKTKWSKL